MLGPSGGDAPTTSGETPGNGGIGGVAEATVVAALASAGEADPVAPVGGSEGDDPRRGLGRCSVRGGVRPVCRGRLNLVRGLHARRR